MFVKALAAAFPLCLAACTAVPLSEPESAGPLAEPSPPAVVKGHEMQMAFLGACERWDEWAKPAPPFQLMGNSWYVGTCGISSVLITDEDGHILIDSGVPEAAPLVLANIAALGFDAKDIRYILMSHEHFDHVGAHAALKEATGAQIVASQKAKPVLETGVIAADDPQADAGHPDMTPVKVDVVVEDGEVLSLGQLQVTAHATPGHSPGALSWTWWSCSLPGEPPVCNRFAYIDSLSAVSADDYRFTDHPEMVRAFRTSIDKVRLLQCDYLVTPHPSAGSMLDLMSGEYGLFLHKGCGFYGERLSQRLDERLAKETAK